MVIAIPIAEASAKVRTGTVNDEPDDADLPYWAGVLPLSIQTGAPIQDPAQQLGLSVPAYVTGYKR